MTKIFINVWYPVDKSNDVGKQYLEVEKVFPFPPIIKPVTPWETWATKYGLKGAGIFEVSEEDFEIVHNCRHFSDCISTRDFRNNAFRHEI